MSGRIRLQKAIADAGVASRRAAEKLIADGKVSVNGVRVTKQGTTVDPGRDRIVVNGVPIEKRKKVLIAFYKPRGVHSTMQRSREKGKILPDVLKTNERLFPVGRLDKDFEGLMLLTNDGALAQELTHPRYEHEKEYRVTVDKHVDDDHLRRLRRPIREGGETLQAKHVERTGDKEITMILATGRKHQIRRMCSRVGLQVRRLVRTRIGEYTLGDQQPGVSRVLPSR